MPHHRRTHRSTLALAVVTALLALSACDQPAPEVADADAAAPPPTFRSINTPGMPWGPCSAVECEFGSECIKAEEGTYCAPNCASPSCSKVQVDACGDLIGSGTSDCTGFVCKHLCANDSDCGVGMVCAKSEGFCVNPGE